VNEITRTAATLLIGNELLSGKIHEANLVELARTLRAVGAELRRAVMVPDEVDVIAREVRELSATHDVLFTSGGVGPTHDDVTMEAVALAFGVPATPHAELQRMLEEVYGAELTEGHRRMAVAPAGARLVGSDAVRWPVVVMRNVWVLPGVPEAFRMKLMLVRDHIRGPREFISRSVLTKMDETTLKPLLDATVGRHPDVDIGSYPKWFEARYKTKITFDGASTAAVERALEHFLSLLPEGEPQAVE